jgi:hypothetical protein
MRAFAPARRAWTPAIGCCVILLAAGTGSAAVPDADFHPDRYLDPQPPITQFTVKPVREADALLNPSELVLAVTLDGHARAYPLNMITGPQRAVLNDTLGGRAIAATW